MCGIVGYIGPQDAAPILLEGLHRLEYRGYDSAGRRRVGQQGQLKRAQGQGPGRRPRQGRCRAGSRARSASATPGGPRTARRATCNAHPHRRPTSAIAVVHNGIIENAAELRAKLSADGVVFVSETDTEVLAHLIARAVDETDTLEEAVREALSAVDGTYGIAVIDAERPGEVVVARNGSPIVHRHRREGDVRRLRRGRAGPLHPPGRAPGRRRAGRARRRRLPHLRQRRARDRQGAADRRLGRRRTTTPAATSTTCSRRSPSSPTRSRAP